MLQLQLIKQAALAEGFAACGVARATRVSAAREHELRQWLAEGCHGDMAYLANHVELKLDPRRLVEGAQTVVSVAANYYPGDWEAEAGAEVGAAHCGQDENAENARFHRCNALRLSRYAYGTDYHEVVKQMLRGMMQRLGLTEGKDGRAFVDTAPIDEKYWAEQCGLGWRGRNSQLIMPGMGSYYFLGELVLTQSVDAYDEKAQNRCGTCRSCLDACPMHALRGDGTLDARRCLSYLTIEQRGNIPAEARHAMQHCFYGCDRCAEACPWNRRFAQPTSIAQLQPRQALLDMTPAQWAELTPEQYRALFKKSAVKRAKFEGVKRNIAAALENFEPLDNL